MIDRKSASLTRKARTVGTILTVLTVSLAACQTVPDTKDDPAELERTWQQALLFLPRSAIKAGRAKIASEPGGKRAYRSTIKEASSRGLLKEVSEKGSLPVVIYLHGCAGIIPHNERSAVYLADTLKTAVIIPDSYARENRPKGCDPRKKRAALFSGAIGFRIAETRHALSRIEHDPGLDRTRVVLMGHSEGGTSVAKFTGPSVRARIIEGVSCASPRPSRHGLNAPESEPVLSIFAVRDPWYVGKVSTFRHCGNFMTHGNGSRSIVIREGVFADKHDTLFAPEAKPAVTAFVREHID